MNEKFYELCYKILHRYLNLPDVADTFRSILKGIDYIKKFPWDINDFLCKKNEIISYIQDVRCKNIIDGYNENPYLLTTTSFSKKLSDTNQNELYSNLIGEIPRLILKGMHQVIKNLYNIKDDNELTEELVQENITVLMKYKLVK